MTSVKTSIGVVRQAIVLVGGKGTRLGDLTRSTPKPLLPISGRPFLEYLIWFLARQGIVEQVFSAGYLAEQIQAILGNGNRFGVNIRYAVENRPLGTGGGVRYAAQFLPQPEKPFFVLNGDTILDYDFRWLIHSLEESKADAGIVLRHVPDVERYGAVVLEGNMVSAFGEKSASGPGFINGGVALFTERALNLLPEGESSLERDLFPLLAKQKCLIGQKSYGFFLDIGLPETYTQAQTVLPAWKARLKKQRPFVLLDRDGTIIEEKNYLHDPEQVFLLPGAVEGMMRLQKAGFGLAVVTNQAGIGRGYYNEAAMHRVNERMQKLLAAHGVTLEGIFFCPHAPDTGCFCRKPSPGMVIHASQVLNFSPEKSYVIGDKALDTDLAVRCGATGILVRTGYGSVEEKEAAAMATYVAETLLDAAEWIIANTSQANL